MPSDPGELVDQLKLLYFEKVRGKDSDLLKEQVIASVDKLLEYEDPPNIKIYKTTLKRIRLWIKALVILIRSSQILYLLPFLTSSLFINI